MGAPGEAFLCTAGHLFCWISDDMDWTDELADESDRIKKQGCPCGRPTLTVISHYGDINDCLDPDARLSEIRVDYVRVKIDGATDAQGQPIDAFVQRGLPVYNVSKLWVNPNLLDPNAEFRLLSDPDSRSE